MVICYTSFFQMLAEEIEEYENLFFDAFVLIIKYLHDL